MESNKEELNGTASQEEHNESSSGQEDSPTERIKHLESKLEQTVGALSALALRFEKMEVEVGMLSAYREILERRPYDEDSSTKEQTLKLAKVVDFAEDENVGLDQALKLIPTAKSFGMEQLTHKLTSHILGFITLNTCIGIFQLAGKHEISELLNKSRKFIQEKFHQVYEAADDFCNLTREELGTFIFSSTICATEEQVFRAIVKWIRFDLSNRKKFVSEFLPAVRLSGCTSRVLKYMLDHFLVHDEEDFKSTVQKAYSDATSENSCDIEPRLRWNPYSRVMVMGGFKENGAECDTFETCSLYNKEWTLTSIPDAPGETTAVNVYGSRILVLDNGTKRFRSLDTSTNTWTDLNPLPAMRFWVCVTRVGDILYVIGGPSDHGRRCDMYSVQNNVWSSGPDMKHSRNGASATTFRGRVYCAGGIDSKGVVLDSVEVLVPPSSNNEEQTGHWTRARSMTEPRRHHILVSCSKFIWAAGGRNGTSNFLSDLCRYDPESDFWIQMCPMTTARACFSAAFVDGHLYVTGGKGKDEEYLSSVEVYDPEHDKWTSCSDLNQGRRFHSACVVQGDEDNN